MQLTGNATNGYSGVLFGDSAANAVGRLSYYHGDNSLRINTNGSEVMRINSSGNVGIGNTSPNRKLHIKNSASATDNAFIRISAGNEGISGIEFGDTDDGDVGKLLYDHDGSIGMRFISGASERMRIKTDGNVGIGTTAPAALLDIMGESGNQLRLSYNANYYWILERDSSGKLNITNHQNDTDVKAITIDTTEQVGIGDTSPAEKLQVAGNIRINNNGAVKADGSGVLVLGNTSGGQVNVGGDGGVSFIEATSNHLVLRTQRDGDDIRFRVNKGGTESDDSVNEAVIIEGNTGNVGIGTTTPAGKFGVQLADATSNGNVSAWDDTYALFGDAASTGGEAVGIGFGTYGGVLVSLDPGSAWENMNYMAGAHFFKEANTVVMSIDNGRVGIGTASPDEPLHVLGTDSGPIAKFERDGQESVYISGNNGWGNLYTSDAVLAFGTGGNAGGNAQMVLNGGNLGIGTGGTVDAKLHVEGSVLIDAYEQGAGAGLFFRDGFLNTNQPSITVQDHSGANPDGLAISAYDGISFRLNGSEKARFDSAGDFGIGTTNPTAKLHVNGDIKCTGLDLQNGALEYGGGVQQSGDLAVGWYTFAVCKGRDATSSAQRAFGEFLINDVDSSRHGSCRLNATHFFGAGNSIQVFAYNFYSNPVFTHLRIKESGTYAGAALQVYVSNGNNNLESYMTLSEQNQSWDLLDTWLADSDDSGHDAILGYATHSQDWSGFAASQTIDLSIFDVSQGGIYTTGGMYAEELELKDSTGITIQTANSNARHKKIFATTSNDGSPWDEMVYYSRGSAGGWSGQHTFTVDKSGTSGTGYEALRIRDSGDGASSIVAVAHKLGVGTTTPSTALDVAGDITGERLNLIKGSGYSSVEMSGPSGAFIDLKNNSSDDFDVRFITDGTGLDINANGSNHITLKTNGTERFIVEDALITVTPKASFTTSVNIGSVTNSPAELNIVRGGDDAALINFSEQDQAAIEFGIFGNFAGGGETGNGIYVGTGITSWTGNDAPIMFFRGDGHVGIGTDSPDTLFEVKETGTGPAVMRLRNSNTSYPDDTAFGRIEFYNADASGAGITAQIEAVSDASGRGGQLAFKTDDTGTSPSTAMFIQGDGKIGINTVSPGYKLDVNGDIRAQDDMYCDKLIASEAIRSSSRASFNTMTYYLYDRQSMGTSAVYLRSVVGGSSSANPSNYAMPHAGKVMQVMMGFYGQTLATSGTDTWTIHKINTGGVTSSVTFDINFANLNRIGTTNNYNILVDVTVLSDASSLDFALGDILQIQRTDSSPIDVEHVNAQLWVTFDA
jgi:hypothetical protein